MSDRQNDPPFKPDPHDAAPTRPLGWAIRILGAAAGLALGVAAVLFWMEGHYTPRVGWALGIAGAAAVTQTVLVTISALRRK